MVRRIPRLAVPCALTLLGAAARFSTLSTASIWYDEAFHVFVSRLDIPEIIQAAAADTLPPLSYLLLHAWMAIAGNDEPILRYFVNAWGLLTVPLTYILGTRLYFRSVGTLAALIVAVGPFFLYWSRELRMYSQMTFLGVLLLVTFLYAWQRPSLARWLLFSLVLTLNLYTHSLTVLLMLAVGLYAAAQAWRTPMRLIPYIAAHLIAALAFLPWLVYLPGQMTRVLARFWIFPPEPLRWFLSFTNFLTGMDQLGDAVLLPRWVLLSTLAACGALLATVAPSLIVLARRQPAERAPAFLLSLVLAVPILAFYLLALVRSLYADRALGVSAIALALLIARAMAVWGQYQRPKLVLAAPVLAVVPVYWWALAASMGLNHLPHAELSARLRTDYRQGDAVIFNNKATYFPAAFYQTYSEQYFLPHPPGSRWDDLSPVTRTLLGFEETPAPVALATSATRVWLVLNGLDAEADVERLLTPLRQSRVQAQAVTWRGDRLWLYRFDMASAGEAMP